MMQKKLQHKWLARKFILYITMVYVFYGMALTGCGTREELRDLEIKKESSSLKEWGDKLKADSKVPELYGKSIRGMEISRDGEDIFAVSYEPRSYKDSFNYWDISVPYQSTVCVDTESMYELFDAVVDILPAEESKVQDMSWESAGLLESGNRFFIAYDSEQAEGEKGRAEPDCAVVMIIGSQDKNGDYYIGLEGCSEIYVASGAVIDYFFNVNPFQYILKVAGVLNIDTVSDVEIVTENAGTKKHYRMSRDGEDYLFQKKKISKDEYQELYTKMLSVLIADEIPREQELDKERTAVLTLNFYRNVEGASDLQMKFYPYDEEYMSVNVNGNEFFLVNKADVDSIYNLTKNVSHF